jgi:hypothetical protein
MVLFDRQGIGGRKHPRRRQAADTYRAERA